MGKEETIKNLHELEYVKTLLQKVEIDSTNKGKLYVWKLYDSIKALQEAIDDYKQRVYPKPKRVIHKKDVCVSYSVYKGLVGNSPLAYLDNYAGIEKVKQEFEDGCSVSISPSPTLELEDDFRYSLHDKDGILVCNTYYEQFVDYWHIVNQKTNEEYVLHTNVENS